MTSLDSLSGLSSSFYNNVLGLNSDLPSVSKAGMGKAGDGPSFRQVLSDLRNTFDQQTSKLSLINLPDDKGTQVYTANPSKTSTVV